MLFLGLGTGLGSAMIWEKTLLSLELGDLPYREGKIIEKFLGKPGLARLGERTWKRETLHAVLQLKRALSPITLFSEEEMPSASRNCLKALNLATTEMLILEERGSGKREKNKRKKKWTVL